MCLQQVIAKQSPDEGRGYKVYFRLGSGNLVSVHMNETVLADAWMLHQEPTKVCKHKPPSILAMIFKGERPCLKYERGFHLFKYPKTAVEFASKLDVAAMKLKRAGTPYCVKGWMVDEVVVKEAFYRDYIAEDELEIVARQLYVPESTYSPVLDSRIVPCETEVLKMISVV